MKKLPLISLLLLGALFVFGLTQLFKLRFEAGDIYPEYSSLRADPLGAKALYESLGSLLAVGRNYRPVSKLGDGRDTTLFWLGSRSSFMFEAKSDLRLAPEEFKSLESFVVAGGRLVISYYPAFQKPSTNRFRAPAPASPPPSAGNRKGKAPTVTPRKAPLDDEDEFQDIQRVSLRERWALDYNYDELSRDANGVYIPAFASNVSSLKGLPDSIACHTALYFDNLTNGLQVIYARKKNRPVVVERRLGAGSIILVADSYPFSNEALWKERSPQLLAWMVGPSQSVVFDETHLGVEESPGISALARKYRLHGLFAGVLLLAGLFVWKNATSFVPPYEQAAERDKPELVAGKDSASGFVNLLRRNIPARDLLAVCLGEWKKTCSREQPKAKLQQVQAIIDAENQRPPGERNPVATYQAISKILSKISPGVRPSPGAATPERLTALYPSSANRLSHVAVPGDGRTPGTSEKPPATQRT